MKTVLIPHSERRKLIEAPLHFTVVAPHTWAGTITYDAEFDPWRRAERARRQSTIGRDDESTFLRMERE